MNRMQSVDKYVSATKRDPGRDAMIAEPRHNLGFGSASEAGFRQPGRQFVRSFSSMGNHASAEARNSHPDDLRQSAPFRGR